MITVGGGRVVTGDGRAEPGRVTMSGPSIVAVSLDDDSTAHGRAGRPDIEAAGGWIVPGFIDLQVNGAAGVDVTTRPERIDEVGAALVRYGVTSFVPTVISCSPPQRAAALAAWAARSAGRRADRSLGAEPLGLHLEGPMLSPLRRGAHPAEHLAVPSAALIDGWSADAGVVLATVAPELAGALDVVAALADRGVVVSVGHTDADAGTVAAALAAGARYATHLFNAMRPFGHRDPGPVGAVLADADVVAGLICDGIHVDPVAVRMAWRVLRPGRLSLVTDAVSLLGAGGSGRDGRLGDAGVTFGAGAVRNAEGVLAGSTLSLDQAVRNLVAFTGCSPAEAVAAVTTTPADLLGITDRGRLAPGLRGDVTVLDADLRVVATIVGGEVAWRS